MKIALPEKVSYLIEQLQSAGWEAYAVGGCVRDRMLGKEPGDWDITTSADPYKVKELFRRTVDTGIKHGTVTVLLGEDSYEVTTYRLDGEYEDSRHPKEVIFTRSLAEDLKRRDFTINAMAYNDRDGLVDLFHGQQDLKNRLICCVGTAEERFEEDALRILRALRFSATLGFEVEENTARAIKEKVAKLRNISTERIREELNKILLSQSPERLIEVQQAGIIRLLLPELELFLTDEVNAERILKGIPEMVFGHEHHTALILAWTVLLNAAAFCNGEQDRKRFSGRVLRQLKFDNDTIKKAGCLSEYSTVQISPDPVVIRKQMNHMGEELFDLWLVYLRGDRFPDKRRVPEHLIDEVCEKVAGIRSGPYCISLQTLAVTGADLIADGRQPGAELGSTLNRLLEKVLEEPELNDRETLLALSRHMIKTE